MNTITHIRKDVLGVTQATFAEIAKTTQATVSRWERGEMQPDLAQMNRIREAAKQAKKRWDDSWFFDVPEGSAQ